MKLQNKILLSVLPVVVLALTVVGLIWWRLSTRSLLKKIRQNTMLMSEGYADELNNRLVDYKRILHHFATDLAARPGDAETLSRKRETHPAFRQLVYTEPHDGTIRHSAPSELSRTALDLSASPHWKRAVETGGVTISEVETFLDEPAVAISAPVLTSTDSEVPEIKGVVTALIPTRQLFEEIDDVRIGTSARVVVFDQQGESVNAHTLPGGHQALREGGDRLEHIATPLLNLETGWGTYRHPDFGECFVAFAPVPATRWSLAVAGRSEALMPGLDRMTLLLLGGLVLAALGASLVIAFNVRNTLEPIRELTDLLEDVEQGAFDVELEADASGEIGQLGRAFNHMTSELQRHREELETRVQERTEEIQRINAELRDEIEERREAERALRESEQRYSALIEQSIEGIYLVEGGSLEIIDFNPAFLELTGYDAEEAHRMHVSEVIVNDDDYYEQMYQHIVSEGGMEPKEGKWRTSSGDTIDVSVTASYFETDDREIVFVVGRDIREKKRLREQLEVTDRLASLGTLAAGLAHEINNPLSYIVTNLYFLQEEFERHGDVLPGERADEWLDVVGQSLDGADRVQQIVDDLRSFYRSDDNEIGLVDVREVFESVVGLAESDLPPDAEIVRQFEEVPPVRANDSALGQVFMNILVNAIQALPQDRRGRSDRILVRTYMEDEKHVGIEISDTGEGISEEDRKHIFDPFFTTKSVDEGTGLGLSMSLNIVTSFDGEIDVESTVGEGTSFHVILPIASASDLSASSIPFEDSTSTGDRRST